MQYRVFLYSTTISTPTQVYPVWDSIIVNKRESGKAYYRKELKSDMVFGGIHKGADYSLIFDLADDCEQVYVDIEKYCADEWVLEWTGRFTKKECDIDERKCIITIKPKTVDLYDCLFEAWDREQNIFDISPIIEVLPFDGALQVEVCTEISPSSGGDPGPADNCISSPDDYCMIEDTEEIEYDIDLNEINIYRYTTWTRVVAEFLSDPGSPWTLISGTTYWRCAEAIRAPYKYGRLLNSVLEYLVDELGCGLTVKSDFLGINSDASAPDNDAYTFAATYLQYLTIHQKSDIICPYCANPSRSPSWNIKLKEALEDLEILLELQWDIDGTVLRIEHKSYYEQSVGLDLSDKSMKLQYEGDLEGVKREEYKFASDVASDYFKGSPIEYNCGDGVKEYRLKLFSTDVASIESSGDNDTGSKMGFVIISNSENSGIYTTINDNRALSWTQLHENLFMHGREFISGTINGSPVTFDSAKRLKKQPEFTIGYCCDDAFDPYDLITTQLGNGEIESNEHNLKKDLLTLTLKYQ